MNYVHPSRYVLRPMEQADVATVASWMVDLDDLSVFDRAERIPLSRAAADRVWQDDIGDEPGRKSYWFALDDENAAAVGVVGLKSINFINRDAILPVFMAPDARHKGIGLRAVGLVVDIGFFQLGLNRVTSFYRSDNETSKHLIERAGFQVEGRIREAWFCNGQFIDMVAVGMLRSEWIDTRSRLASELDSNTIVTFGKHGSARWSWPPSPEGDADRVLDQ